MKHVFGGGEQVGLKQYAIHYIISLVSTELKFNNLSFIVVMDIRVIHSTHLQRQKAQFVSSSYPSSERSIQIPNYTVFV